ncbi:MAG TPA: radical SAM protein [bacterium]|nr:radical SAM protein [bacterium]
MIKNLMHKITKRLHPWPLIQYDLRKNWRGFRNPGGGIDCHGADHIHVYMTMKCNFSCSFCINNLLAEHGKISPYQDVKEWAAWVYHLNSLTNFRELYFNGGEHLLLPYFPDVINNLRGFNINIFSNLPRKGLDNLRRLQKNNNNIILRTSYHPLSDEPLNMFVDRYRQIPKDILSSVIIIKDSGISTEMYIDGFSRYGIHATAADLVCPGLDTSKTKNVMCNSMEHIIGPNMQVYRCAYNLVNNIGGVSIQNYEFRHKEEPCNNYPKCFSCSSAYAKIRLIRETIG